MSRREERPEETGEEGRIDADYYDRSEYFGADSAHLRDMKSAFQRYRIRKVLEIYRPGPEERVLDLGCGWGTFSFALAREADRVVGVDFSERSIAHCRERQARSAFYNLRFVQADAGDTGLDADSFDVVVAADLYEHLYPDDSRRVTAEAWRVLKRGGRFVIWTPHRGHLLEVLKNNGIVLRPDPTHVDYKSMEALRELLDAEGFVIEKAYYAESHLPVLRDVERALMGRIPLLRRRIAVLARKV